MLELQGAKVPYVKLTKKNRVILEHPSGLKKMTLTPR